MRNQKKGIVRINNINRSNLDLRGLDLEKGDFLEQIFQAQTLRA